MKPTKNYDLFISYARRDNQAGADHTGFIDAFVQGIIAEHRRFTSSDLHIFFDRETIRSMDDWSHRLLEGLRHSRLLLAFLSPNYFASEYCRWEWEHYLRHEQGQSLTGRGIAPIYFAEVPGFESGALASAAKEWLDDMKRRQFVDLREWSRSGAEALRGVDVRSRMEALSLSISDRLEMAERAERAIGLVARHNQHFIGRHEEIRRLREALAMGRMGVIAALHGLGGIGKTALAVEYAHAYAGDYPGGRWTLECEGIADLRTAFLQLIGPLGIDLSPEEKRDPAAGLTRVLARLRELTHGDGVKNAPGTKRESTAGFARLLARLRKLTHGDGVKNAPKGNPVRPASLVILDNVSEPALLSQAELARLPAEDWLHVLATTRLGPADLGKNTPECDFVSLDELPVRDAVDLIRSHQPGGRFANPADEAIAHTIAVDLGGFTLAVEAAAVFLGIHAGEVGFEDFLARLREEGVAATDAVAIETSDGVATSIHHRGKQLSAVILPMLSRLDAVETGALEWAALLPPDCVVLPWIKDLLAGETPSLADPVRPGYPEPWHRAVRRLSGWRIFSSSRDPAPDSNGAIRLVRMHRLVGEILRQRAPERETERRQALIAYLLKRLLRLRDLFHLQENQWEIPPLRAAIDHLLARDFAGTLPLALHLASRLNDLADFEGARILLERCRDHVDIEPRFLLALRTKLADTYHQCGRMAEAEAILREDAALAESSGDPALLARALEHLGTFLAADQPAEAEQLLGRAIELTETHNIDSRRGLAELKGLRAIALTFLERYAEAVPLFEERLRHQIEKLGRVHPSVSMTMNNLAEALRRSGQFEKAEPHFRQALGINRQCLPEGHPDIATDLNNFAMFLDAWDRKEDAIPYYRESLRLLAAYKKKTGLELPYHAGIRTNFETCLSDTGVRWDKISETIQDAENNGSPSVWGESERPASEGSGARSDHHGWQQLLNAVALGNLSTVKEILATGADVNCTRGDGTGALHAAAQNGHAEVLRHLISAGANVNAVNDSQMTPLLSAVTIKSEECVELLLAAGADPRIRCTLEGLNGFDALITAVIGAPIAVIQSLLRHGADIRAKDDQGRTALHHAAGNGHAEIIHALIDHGADVNAKDKDEDTPLSYAARKGHRVICELLLANKADLEASNIAGFTPLLAACQNDIMDPSDIVSFLITQGACIEACSTHSELSWARLLRLANQWTNEGQETAAQATMDILKQTDDSSGWRPLMLAASRGHLETGKLLLDRGAQIDARTDRGQTALRVAAANGRAEFCRLLMDCGAELDVRDNDDYTPLMRACNNKERDQAETVALLLNKGAGIEAASKDGLRPLMIAAQHGHLETGKLLLERGAQVDARRADGATALWVAAANGRTDFCCLLLERGAELDVRDNDQYSPLMLACNKAERDQAETVALLLGRGANIEAASKIGFRPLMLAASHGHLETGKLLLERGAQIDARKDVGGTALWVAAINGRTECCRLLLERGAELDVRDNDQYTPLMRACNNAERDQAETVALLLDKGADIEAASENGWRALMIAAQHGHLETGKLLLERGAQVDARKDGGGTALWVAAANGRKEFCLLLLDRGAELNLRDNDDYTPLMCACNNKERDQAETVALLLERGANIEAASKDGWRSLMIAAQYGHSEIAKLLLERGAQIDARKDGGGTALWVAAANGRTQFCRLLLDRGAELDARDKDDYTPLMRACNKAEHDQSETVALLLDRGANIEAAGKDGFRPLMLAASRGHLETGKLLLKRSAQVDARNNNGLTALCVAAGNRHTEFCLLLLQRGAELDVRGNDGFTPLLRACDNAERDQSETVALLLDRGADIEAAKKDGWRPLMIAAQHGHLETGKLLLERGAQVDARKNDGGTALWVAAANGRTDFCRMLLDWGTALDARDGEDYTPLMRACNNAEREQAETVAMLLDSGADIEAAQKDGWRPLMLAASHGHLETGKLLLERGAQIDARKDGGGTALWVAAINGRTECCRLLLERGAELDVRDNDQYTPLMRACNNAERDQAETVALLLDKGADIEAASENGWRSLMIAAQHGHLETRRLLLERGAQVDARKNDGGTALIVAATNGRTEFCCLLLDRGAELDVRDDYAYTPLMWACNSAEREQVETIALLLDRGARIEAAEKDGWRPLMLAAQHGHVGTGKLLLERCAEIEVWKNDGGTALVVAAANGRADFCRMLLERGANKRAMCVRGYTSATWASGAANIPDILPALFGVDVFTVDTVRQQHGNRPDGFQVRIEALVCASDMALREDAPDQAREHLLTAVQEISERGTEPEATLTRCLVLPRLAAVSNITKQYTTEVEFRRQFVDLLRQRMKEHAVLEEDLMGELSTLSWSFLLASAYPESIPVGEESVRRLTTEASHCARMNLAHAYLFNDRFDEAKAIHEQYLGTAFEDGRAWNDELLNDFKLLREAGHDHPYMARIEAMLKDGE